MLIAPLVVCLVTLDAAAPRGPGTAGAAVVSQDSAIEAKIAAAGKDLAKLLELASTCSAAGQDGDAKKVYRKVIELDPDHEAARKALGHQLYDKKWFESFAELAKYKREEAARMKAKGLARFKEEWVPEGDLPFLNMGWVKDEKGAWANPLELARAKQAAEWSAAGYQFRADDNSWIAPADVQHWTALLWKCGEEWVDLPMANRYHSKPETAWELAGEHFVVITTCEWDGGNAARWYADKSYPELVRLFGIEPKGRPEFVVFDSLAQYNQAAGGNPPLLPDAEGYSSFHGAYFADLVFDFTASPPQFQGCGVSFWDRKDEKLRGWGPYWLRWAAAQSFVDAIDPSWGFVGESIAAGPNGARPTAANFWSEKRIPRWLRYGAASYVERFMKDPEAAQGASPWGLRDFAFAELKKNGGLRKLDEVFAFGLDITKIESSSRLYHEAGAVVAFLLDGAPADKKLAARHEAFKAALKSGQRKEIADAVSALQKELASRERELRAFVGL